MVTALRGTPFERIARLVAARVESFARPAPLLRQPGAKTGAMDTARVLSASAPTAPTAACTPMTVDEVWNTQRSVRRALALHLAQPHASRYAAPAAGRATQRAGQHAEAEAEAEAGQQEGAVAAVECAC